VEQAEYEVSTRARPFAGRAVLAAFGGLALLAALVWHATGPMAWERPVISAFVHRPIPLRDHWIKMFQPASFALVAITLACVAIRRRQERLAIAGFAGCVGALLAAQVVLKPLVDRARPYTARHAPHFIHRSHPMFPSSHVTAAASLAMFAWLILGRRTKLAPVLVAIPLIVGHSVISRGMHYPADVIGGLLLGPTFVYCAVALIRSFDGRNASPRSDRVPALFR
jgi:membrane-associated phospholipid phosphatase